MKLPSAEINANRFMVTPLPKRLNLAEGEIPWSSDAAWQACRMNLKMAIAAAGTELDPARAIAQQIVHLYTLAGDLFDELAAESCSVCEWPCCRDARVWFDFKDLLLIHFSAQPLPPAQLRSNRWAHCHYLDAHGCTLPRSVRPWVCTWYVCPDQRRVLVRDIPGGPERLAGWWEKIAALRNTMEDVFLTVVPSLK